MGTELTGPVADWLAGFARAAADPEAVAAWVGRIDRAILAEVGPIAADPLLTADLHASTRAHWEGFLAHLQHPELTVPVLPAAETLAVNLAGRGLDLGVLLKVYRVAQQATWQYATEVAAGIGADGPSPEEILVPLWSRAGVWIDHTVERLITVFDAERSRLRRGAEARRIAVVGRILADGVVDETDSSATLGHLLAARHSAFVLWAEDDDAAGCLGQVAAALAATMDAPEPLQVPHGERALACWAIAPGSGVPPRAAATALLAENRMAAAFGSPASGAAGFRHGHREALAVRRLIRHSGGRHRLLCHDEVGLPAILSADPAAADAWATRLLGPLAGADETLARLRRTLFEVVAAERTAAEAAERLHVHKNTVRYRLAQAEELIGDGAAPRRADLAVALRWLEVCGRL